MATLNTATHKRSVLDSQPLPKRSSEANGQKERQKENRHISLSDAGVLPDHRWPEDEAMSLRAERLDLPLPLWLLRRAVHRF